MNNRIFNVAAVFVYIISFIWGYIVWVNPVWEYIGISSRELFSSSFVSTFIFSALPILWMPREIKRPTMILYWLLYLMTYIPMVVGVSFSSKFSSEQVFLFNLSLLIGFYFTSLSYNFRLYRFRKFSSNNIFFWRFFYFVMGLLFLYVFIVFKGNFKLVSPFDKDLYDLRFSGSDLSLGTGVGYPILWLSGGFLPFLLSVGLFEKKRILIIYSFLGQILLYMTQANKSFIFSIFLMAFTYILVRKVKNFGNILALLLSLGIVLLVSTQLYLDEKWQLFFFELTSVFIVRTLAISSINIIYYYDFFSNHPLTYYSHINFVRLFYDNPYGKLDIGSVVGYYFSKEDVNYCANANFYLTDGLVALGLPGLLVIGVISCLIFYLIDSVSAKHNIWFTSTLISYSGLNLMNVSIFTTLLSGGLLFLILFMFYYKPHSLD